MILQAHVSFFWYILSFDQILETHLKKLPTKNDIRCEMQKQINEFLQRGGEVKNIAQGVSGRTQADGAFRTNHTVFQPRSEERTFVPEVIAALEERTRQMKQPPVTPSKKKRSPKKVPVYDDFGEVLRYEWKDE